ncbi:hypothetical protein JCM24511_01376 [Saitozyma sp. JCM 24511]|nr:hypothetical protein JCM24511_01376 [Saitozyma sp. JCM 24511]
MAHPLTQHPPSALPFPSASRPSPLAFGFGFPSSSSSFTNTSPFASVSGARAVDSYGPIAFASPSANGASGAGGVASSPSRAPLHPVRVTFGLSPRSGPSVSTSLKRSRASPSPTPSSSPSPGLSPSDLPSLRPSKRRLSLKGKERDDPLSVGGLDLKDEEAPSGIPRQMKRLRKVVEETKGDSTRDDASDVDVGVLLAALPPSSHLQILLSLLKSNPFLRSTVLATMPSPDVQECLREMDKAVEKVKRAYGWIGTTSEVDKERSWTRSTKEIEAFCSTASTYLSFFSSPSNQLATSTLHTFLSALTAHILTLLRLMPSSAQTAPRGPLLRLGETILPAWDAWLSNLSDEVNNRGEMYPHSLVSSWADNLDSLANAASVPQAASSGWSASTWSSPLTSTWGHPTANPAQPSHPLVDAFVSAVRPIRDRFLTQLGWLIGRQPVISQASIPPPAPFAPPSFGSFPSTSSGPAPSAWSTSIQRPLVSSGNEDEEL